MAGGENEKKGESKGFAGLSSLVSDVDTTPPPAAEKEPAAVKKEPAAAAPSAPRPAPQPAQPQPQPQTSQRQAYQEPSQPSSGSSGGKWVLGIAAVIGVFWLIGQADKPTTSSAPSYSPPTQNAAPSYTPPPHPQPPSRPVETEPPVGQDLVLSREQIRYCFAEDIRLDAAKSAVNNYVDADVDRFNAMVTDYNSRCGSFRYHTNNRGRNDLNSARRDIEQFRSQLQSEGRSRFSRPPTGSLSMPPPLRTAPDVTVQAIQRKLNELGYAAGAADGLMGRGTRSAIIAFQQDRGLAATGVADQALLLQLQRAHSRPTTAVTAPSTSSPPSAQPNAPRLPDLSKLGYEERSAIQQACFLKKSDGAASYNRCVTAQLNELNNAPRLPDLSKLGYEERSAIQQACFLKKSDGAASYNRCVTAQLNELNNAPRPPDLSELGYEERSAIQQACFLKKSDGAASYNRCVTAQLNELNNAPRLPDLSKLGYEERSAIQQACFLRKSDGAASYNRCVVAELRALGR
ncbi:MAG: peptidoglycan-binding protein [Xanthomonadales bacterium]|nr:peptidoglycan-binding protein [Xanthomonadales bacterium]